MTNFVREDDIERVAVSLNYLDGTGSLALFYNSILVARFAENGTLIRQYLTEEEAHHLRLRGVELESGKDHRREVKIS